MCVFDESRRLIDKPHFLGNPISLRERAEVRGVKDFNFLSRSTAVGRIPWIMMSVADPIELAIEHSFAIEPGLYLIP